MEERVNPDFHICVYLDLNTGEVSFLVQYIFTMLNLGFGSINILRGKRNTVHIKYAT